MIKERKMKNINTVISTFSLMLRYHEIRRRNDKVTIRVVLHHGCHKYYCRAFGKKISESCQTVLGGTFLGETKPSNFIVAPDNEDNQNEGTYYKLAVNFFYGHRLPFRYKLSSSHHTFFMARLEPRKERLDYPKLSNKNVINIPIKQKK
jgi:hypothetical protein